MSKAQVKQQFGAHARAYATSPVHAKGASLNRLVALVEPQPTWHALDVASAAGHTAFVFAPHVASVIASDITPEMLPVAAELAAQKGIENVTFQEADAEELPFDDGQFHLVTCRIAPHHFPNIDQFLAESFRVLAPGGILAVVDNVTPGAESEPAARSEEDALLEAAGRYINEFERLRDPSHGRCLSVHEWQAALTAAGFQEIHVETALKRMLFEPWAQRMGASSAIQEQLRDLLLNAPPFVMDFLQPEAEGEDVAFYLTEAILVGRKPLALSLTRRDGLHLSEG